MKAFQTARLPIPTTAPVGRIAGHDRVVRRALDRGGAESVRLALQGDPDRSVHGVVAQQAAQLRLVGRRGQSDDQVPPLPEGWEGMGEGARG